MGSGVLSGCLCLGGVWCLFSSGLWGSGGGSPLGSGWTFLEQGAFIQGKTCTALQYLDPKK